MIDSGVLKSDANVEVSSVAVRIKRRIYLIIKRIFDIIVSGILLIILSPLFFVVGVFIRFEDGKAPILKQNRIGKDGKVFRLYKFRSMVKYADNVLEEMLKDPKIEEEYKKSMKLANDPRITKVGKFIRKSSIDELPQLFNVLKGDMSLIGNRPYLPREKCDMGDYYKSIVSTKPGITGYWQVSGRSKLTFKDRLKLESFYSKNMGFRMDIKIFFKTFYVVFKRMGAE